jgi:hypothetical protein
MNWLSNSRDVDHFTYPTIKHHRLTLDGAGPEMSSSEIISFRISKAANNFSDV